MAVSFTCTTQLPIAAEEAFDLARDVDVHVATMAASGERAVAGTTSGLLELGDEVTWQARHLGRTWEMRIRMTELDRPHRFVDEQVDGPFRRFRHEHLFAPQPGGGTTVTDRVRFAAPYGPLGRLAEPLLARYLRRLICRRTSDLAR